MEWEKQREQHGGMWMMLWEAKGGDENWGWIWKRANPRGSLPLFTELTAGRELVMGTMVCIPNPLLTVHPHKDHLDNTKSKQWSMCTVWMFLKKIQMCRKILHPVVSRTFVSTFRWGGGCETCARFTRVWWIICGGRSSALIPNIDPTLPELVKFNWKRICSDEKHWFTMSSCECQHVGVRDIATRNLWWVVLKSTCWLQQKCKRHISHSHTKICICCSHICCIGVLGLRASILVIIHSWAGAKVCVSCGLRSLQISLVRVGFAKQCSWCSWLCAPSVSQCTFYLSHPPHNLLRCACIYTNYILLFFLTLNNK